MSEFNPNHPDQRACMELWKGLLRRESGESRFRDMDKGSHRFGRCLFCNTHIVAAAQQDENDAPVEVVRKRNQKSRFVRRDL